MYCLTRSSWDGLTLNAPYPCCHANEGDVSRIQRLEFAFRVRTASANAVSAGKTIQKVDVVRGPAHGQNVHPVIASDSGEVVPQTGLMVGRNELRALFGAEDD